MFSSFFKSSGSSAQAGFEVGEEIRLANPEKHIFR